MYVGCWSTWNVSKCSHEGCGGFVRRPDENVSAASKYENSSWILGIGTGNQGRAACERQGDPTITTAALACALLDQGNSRTLGTIATRTGPDERKRYERQHQDCLQPGNFRAENQHPKQYEHRDRAGCRTREDESRGQSKARSTSQAKAYEVCLNWFRNCTALGCATVATRFICRSHFLYDSTQ
jgi:hypothetical protein